MIKWFRERSTQEKWMIALIAVLVLGIVVRWAWVSNEVAGAFRERFSPPSEQTVPARNTPAENAPADSLPK